MFELLFGALLTVAAIICWTLQKTYQQVPTRELKRMARGGDEVATLLYRAAGYGVSLRVLLRGTTILFGVLALGTLSASIGLWLALLVLAALLALGWVVMVPGDELTASGLWLAKKAAPAIAWLLERLHPVINGLVRFMRRFRHVYVHTGLYEKSDLIELLEQQKGQADSRISPSEIELLQHTLSFGDKLVVDALVPLRVVKTVAASDAIGPVLMDELSKSGHSRFPVYDGGHDNIVGILYLHDLVGAKHGGRVADVMNRKLTYIHEDFTLYQVLQAFLKTKRHLFLVVNSFEELVGILTVEDVLEQVIGVPIMDEFDKYDDLRAVAAATARKEHEAHQKDESEPPVEPDEPTPEAKEVVE